MAEQEEKKSGLAYDFNILGYSQIAAQYLKKGDMASAGKSLELIAKDAKVSDPWMQAILANPKSTEIAIQSAMQTYAQFSQKQTVGDLLSYYSNDISKYIDGGIERAQEDLKGFTGTEYSKIMREYLKAERVQEGLDSKEDVEKAKKTLEKYSTVMSTIDMAQSLRASEFELRVKKEVMKDSFKEMYPKREEKKE